MFVIFKYQIANNKTKIMKNKDIKGVYGFNAMYETNQRIHKYFKDYLQEVININTDNYYGFYPYIGCLRVYKQSLTKNGIRAKEPKNFDKDTRLSLSAYIKENEMQKLKEKGTVIVKDDLFDMEICTNIHKTANAPGNVNPNTDPSELKYHVEFQFNIYSHIENIEKVIGKKQEPHHELTDVNGTPIKIGDRLLYHKYRLNISVLKGYDEKHMLMENGDKLIIYSDKCKDVLVVNNKKISIKR